MNEEERLIQLQSRRRQSQLARAAQKISQAAARTGQRINPIIGGLIFGFAVLVDILDYLVIGSIPVVGDVVDLMAGGTIWLWVKISIGTPWYISWSPGIAALIEFIPFLGDLPPSFTMDVLFIWVMSTSWGQRMAKLISPV